MLGDEHPRRVHAHPAIAVLRRFEFLLLYRAAVAHLAIRAGLCLAPRGLATAEPRRQGGLPGASRPLDRAPQAGSGAATTASAARAPRRARTGPAPRGGPPHPHFAAMLWAQRNWTIGRLKEALDWLVKELWRVCRLGHAAGFGQGRGEDGRPRAEVPRWPGAPRRRPPGIIAPHVPPAPHQLELLSPRPRRRHRHRGGQPWRGRGLYRRTGLRRAGQRGQRTARPGAAHPPCAPLPQPHLRHAQHHPARRRTRRRPPHGLAGVRGRRRRAHHPGHGPAGNRPAPHPAAREHTDGHPHAREGSLPAGRRAVADRAGARAHGAGDRGHPRCDRPGALHDRVLHPRRTLRGLQRPVLHQPRAYRPQRQPRRLQPGLPPALPGDGRRRPLHRARQARALDEGQQPVGQPAPPHRRGGAQLQDRRAVQGHGLREERHGPLPPAARRDHRGARDLRRAPWPALPAARRASPSRPTRTRTSTASSPTIS